LLSKEKLYIFRDVISAQAFLNRTLLGKSQAVSRNDAEIG